MESTNNSKLRTSTPKHASRNTSFKNYFARSWAAVIWFILYANINVKLFSIRYFTANYLQYRVYMGPLSMTLIIPYTHTWQLNLVLVLLACKNSPFTGIMIHLWAISKVFQSSSTLDLQSVYYKTPSRTHRQRHDTTHRYRHSAKFWVQKKTVKKVYLSDNKRSSHAWHPCPTITYLHNRSIHVHSLPMLFFVPTVPSSIIKKPRQLLNSSHVQ